MFDELMRHLNELQPTVLHSSVRGLVVGRRQLVHADWPGNVRQLENTIARLAALSSGSAISLADYQSASGAVSPTYESRFSAPDTAADILMQLWTDGGRLVDRQWTEADNAISSPNVRPPRLAP